MLAIPANDAPADFDFSMIRVLTPASLRYCDFLIPFYSQIRRQLATDNWHVLKKDFQEFRDGGNANEFHIHCSLQRFYAFL